MLVYQSLLAFPYLLFRRSVLLVVIISLLGGTI